MRPLLFICLVPLTVSGQNLKVTGKTLKVATIENAPFLARNEGGVSTGYIVDLLNELSKQLKFYYTLDFVKDGRYGAFNKSTGSWSGMVGAVVEGAADIAIADITITSRREQAVDFTYPFMDSGIGLLYKKNKGFSPPPSAIEDFAARTDLHVGVTQGGSTYNYLKHSDFEVYQKLFERLSGPDSKFLTKNNTEGISAVKKENGGLGFFMETPGLHYALQNNCGLVQIGKELNKKGYGIVLPLGSQYRKEFNIAILQLQEKGILDQLRYKWFNKSRKCNCKCKGKNCKSKDETAFDNVLSWIIGY